MRPNQAAEDRIIQIGILEQKLSEARAAFQTATNEALKLEGVWLALMNNETEAFKALTAAQTKIGPTLDELHRLQREIAAVMGSLPVTPSADAQA